MSGKPIPGQKPKKPGMKNAGDTFMLWRHNISGHWIVRSLSPWESMPIYTVVDFGYGDRDSLPHRRAIAARDRLQAATDEANAAADPHDKVWLSKPDIQLILDAVRAEVQPRE